MTDAVVSYLVSIHWLQEHHPSPGPRPQFLTGWCRWDLRIEICQCFGSFPLSTVNPAGLCQLNVSGQGNTVTAAEVGNLFFCRLEIYNILGPYKIISLKISPLYLVSYLINSPLMWCLELLLFPRPNDFSGRIGPQGSRCSHPWLRLSIALATFKPQADKYFWRWNLSFKWNLTKTLLLKAMEVQVYYKFILNL